MIHQHAAFSSDALRWLANSSNTVVSASRLKCRLFALLRSKFDRRFSSDTGVRGLDFGAKDLKRRSFFSAKQYSIMCPHHSDKEESADPQISYDRSWPEERREGDTWLGLVCRRWTYSYMNKLLDKGSKQTLDDGTNLCPDDLYRVPHTLESDYLVSKFRQHYEAERHRKRPFIWTLWRLAAPTFVPAGFCQLITVFAQVAIPLFVMQLLKIVEDNSGEKIVDQGIQYAILLFVASLVNAFGNHRHRHLATKSGIVMRASVVSVIYHNALHLTPEGRKGLTTGEVTNLLAIDTQKLFEVTQEGHLIWSCPLSMLLVLILLLIVMGPTTLVGMAVLVMFVPLVQMVASKMLAIRRERIKITDERVEIVSAMLQGVSDGV
jgi:hypothetical protein